VLERNEGEEMKRRQSRLVALVVALFWSGWMLLVGTSSATLEHLKEAKASGVPAQSCDYCHMDKVPKKDDGKHDPNDRGKWLLAEKDKRHAKAVDGGWLKDYKAGK